MSPPIRKQRATIVWVLTLIGAVLIIPALIASLLAATWRSDAIDTRYESHFVGQMRVVGIGLMIGVLALLSPDYELRVIIAALGALFVLAVSISGLRRARGERVFPPIRRTLGLMSGRERSSYDPTQS